MKKITVFLLFALVIPSLATAQVIAQISSNKSPEAPTTSSFVNDDILRAYPDSVRLEFPALHALVVFRMKDFEEDMPAINKLPSELSHWLRDIEAGVADTGAAHAIQIRFTDNGDRKMVITPQKTERTEVISRNNSIVQLLPPGWEIQLVENNVITHIYAQTFWELKLLTRENFQVVTQRILTDQTNDLTWKGLDALIILRDQNIEHSEIKRRDSSDFLSVALGTGFGFVKDKFYPEFNVSAEVLLTDWRNAVKQKININANLMLFGFQHGETGFRTVNNSFLSASYNVNLNPMGNHASWIGFGAGVNLSKSNELFRQGAIKIFLNTTSGRFNLSPELFLGNRAFKDPASAGFKVSYTF